MLDDLKANNRAWAERMVAHDPDFFSKDLARRRAVTPANVKDAVAKYLKPTARVTLTIRQGKKPQENK